MDGFMNNHMFVQYDWKRKPTDLRGVEVSHDLWTWRQLSQKSRQGKGQFQQLEDRIEKFSCRHADVCGESYEASLLRTYILYINIWSLLRLCLSVQSHCLHYSHEIGSSLHFLVKLQWGLRCCENMNSFLVLRKTHHFTGKLWHTHFLWPRLRASVNVVYTPLKSNHDINSRWEMKRPQGAVVSSSLSHDSSWNMFDPVCGDAGEKSRSVPGGGGGGGRMGFMSSRPASAGTQPVGGLLK